VFKLAISRDKTHSVNRFVLLGILFVSAILPFVDIPVFNEIVVIPKVEVFNEFVATPVSAEMPVFENTQLVIDTKQININWYLLFYLSIISVLFIRLLISIAQVLQIIKEAEKQQFQRIILVVVKDLIQPFTFINRVVLSEKDFNENKDIVVAHEHAHIKQLHAIDLLVCELFTLLHFFNPLMWLLRNDLKLVHEFQADQAVLDKGIDAKKYQLLVLQKSVGERRFAMANYFAQKPILKRLKMMQKRDRKQWNAVKLIVFIPIVLLLLQAFAKPEIITVNADKTTFGAVQQSETEKWLERWTLENIGKGFFQPAMKSSDSPQKPDNVLVILLNSKNQYLIENELAKKEEVKQIVKDFLHGKDRHGKQVVDYVEKEIPGFGKMKVSKGVTSFRYDIASSDFQKDYTIRAVGEAYLDVIQEKSKELFNIPYFSLSNEKREIVKMAAPIWFSIAEPKVVKPPAPAQPLKIGLLKNGEIKIEKESYTSFDEVEKTLVKMGTGMKEAYKKYGYNSPFIVNLKVENGVTDEQINEFKEVFRNAGVENVNIIWEKKTSPPPPFRLNLYKDKIVYKGKQIKVSEIEEKAKEFLIDAKTNYSIVYVYYDIPEEKLNQVTDALQNAGIKKIDISEIK
jgi:beta-lactamase regulating signal transducer with metallopeptidase domain/biopolymer transport protein ExbD